MYYAGQIIPLESRQGIVGDALARPIWHAVFVPPNKERSTTEALKSKGCFAFYPKRTAKWFVRGKKIERDFPQITGMIYVRFKFTPHWHIMRERRLITGVMSVGTKPIGFPSEIIRRVQGLPGRAEALQQARKALTQICKGDTVQLSDGPLAGHFVQVSDIRADGTVFWFNDVLKGQARAGSMAKEGGPTEAEIQRRADQIMQSDS